MLPLERSGLGSEECRGRLKDFELAEDNKLRGLGPGMLASCESSLPARTSLWK